MARIIYGVCGEGYGHSSRSKEVLTHLKNKGHEIIVVGHDKSYKILKKHFKTVKTQGLYFVFRKNKVDYWKTIAGNVRRYPKFFKSFRKLDNLFREFKPDIAFTDFEPLTGLVANINKVPLVSIDNQHRLANMWLSVPKKYRRDAITAEIVVRAMIRDTIACLVLTFFFGKKRNKKTFFFKPIIRREILKLKPKQGRHILVYQTSKSNRRLFRILKKIGERFIIYGFDKKKKDKNLLFKKHSTTGFFNDLKNCKAVIMNGGFSLMTEAIYLKKPVLSEPVKGQFEQIINAIHLDRLGYGKFEETLTAEKVKRFIKDIPKYRKNLKKYKQKDNKRILKKIDSLVKSRC